MTKDEMKNRISMALKDPILQQGFECICKDLAISEHDREHNDYELIEVYKKIETLEKENAELKNRNAELAGQKASLERWFGEAKEIIKLLLWDLRNRSYEPIKDVERAEQFLKEEQNG